MYKKVAVIVLVIIAVAALISPESIIMPASEFKFICFYPQFLAWLLLNGYVGFELLLFDEPNQLGKQTKRILRIVAPAVAILIPLWLLYSRFFSEIDLVKPSSF